MDLSASSVFIDFDGTITKRDTGEYLLERLGSAEWKRYDALFDAGAIGSKECLTAQFAMIPRDEKLVLATAAEVPIDEAFPSLIAFLHASGCEITVVSDGFGLLVSDRCDGLPVLTNEADIETGTIRFPNARPDCECARCGTCKALPVQEAKAAGRFTIVIGDGTSDRYAARRADMVFAKEGLALWCSENAIAFHEYETLGDVELSLRAGVG